MSNSYSGAENVAITIINNSNQFCDCAYYSPLGPIEKILNSNGIKYYKCKNIISLVKDLNKVIEDFKPNLIHAHDYFASFISAYNKRNIPVISHLHNDSPFIQNKGILSRLYLCSSKHYNKILVVSQNIIDKFIFSEKIKDKFIVMDNPIDTQLINNKAKENICKKEYDVIFVGRLIKLKDPIRYCEIAKELLKEHPKYKFAIVGDGPLINEVNSFIKDNKLEGSIDVLGNKNNPYSYMAHSKILCMTSQREGFGLVACEAMTLGKPVVATPVKGLNNIINEYTGFYCKSNVEFIQNINLLLDDDKLYNKMSMNCAKHIDAAFNIENYINKLKSIYNI